MYNKSAVLQLLEASAISYELTEHPAVCNMEEAAALTLPYPQDEAKNLFVRDDKKRCYYLITVKGNKRVDLKQFRKDHGTRPLSFASDADLWQYLQLTPGSVTPLGLLNNTAHNVVLYLDHAFLEDFCRIGIHPNDNTATIWMNTADLIQLLEAHGTTVHTVKL